MRFHLTPYSRLIETEIQETRQSHVKLSLAYGSCAFIGYPPPLLSPYPRLPRHCCFTRGCSLNCWPWGAFDCSAAASSAQREHPLSLVALSVSPCPGNKLKHIIMVFINY